MKKLLFLLPFLILKFSFGYGETYLEYKIQDVNKTDSKIAVKENFQYCFYELKENIPKTFMYIFNQGTGFYITAWGTPPNLSPNFGTTIYENLGSSTCKCSDGYDGCTCYNVNLYNPVVNCSRFNSDGSCASGRRVCVTCDISKNEFPNPDTNSCITCPVGETFNYEFKKCIPECGYEQHYNDVLGKCVCDNPNAIFDPATGFCEKSCKNVLDDFTRFDCICRAKNLGNFTGNFFNPSKNYCKTGFTLDVLLDNNSTCVRHLDAPLGLKDLGCFIKCSKSVLKVKIPNGGVVDNTVLDSVKSFCHSDDINSTDNSNSDIDSSNSIDIDLSQIEDDDGSGGGGATGNTGLNGGDDNGGNDSGNTGGNNNNNDNDNDNTGGNTGGSSGGGGSTGGGNSGGNDDNYSGATGNTGLNGGDSGNNGDGSTTITTDNGNTGDNNNDDNNNGNNNGGIGGVGGGGNNQNNLDCENGNCELYGNIIIESSDNTDYMGEIDKMIDGGSLTGQIQDAITFFNKGYVPSIQNFPAPKSCVLSREFSGTKISPVKVDVDFCKVLSPLRDPFYMLFYISFVISFLIAGFKLLVVLFIGVK